MLHWYVAMGLSKQHHLQQVMLARVRDIGLAQTLVRVVQRVLCVGHASVRYLCKDEGDNALLCGLWCESNSIVVSEPLPSVHSDVLAAAEHVRAGTALVDSIMGFSKQHHLQQVMLARVRDIGLAQTLVRVVQRVLCVGHASVRYLCKDEGDNALLCGLWCESNSIVVSEPLPSVHSDVLAAAEHVRAGTAVVDSMPFLSELLSGCPALLPLV